MELEPTDRRWLLYVWFSSPYYHFSLSLQDLIGCLGCKLDCLYSTDWNYLYKTYFFHFYLLNHLSLLSSAFTTKYKFITLTFGSQSNLILNTPITVSDASLCTYCLQLHYHSSFSFCCFNMLSFITFIFVSIFGMPLSFPSMVPTIYFSFLFYGFSLTPNKKQVLTLHYLLLFLYFIIFIYLLSLKIFYLLWKC